MVEDTKGILASEFFSLTKDFVKCSRKFVGMYAEKLSLKNWERTM